MLDHSSPTCLPLGLQGDVFLVGVFSWVGPTRAAESLHSNTILITLVDKVRFAESYPIRYFLDRVPPSIFGSILVPPRKVVSYGCPSHNTHSHPLADFTVLAQWPKEKLDGVTA